MTSPKGYVAGGAESYRYEVAPFGQEVLLLTCGGVCTKGKWYGSYGKFFWGWAPLPSRDRLREAELGLSPTFKETE